MFYRLFLAAFAVSALAVASSASAEAPKDEYTITIKDHMFNPQSIEVPANQKVKLVIDNQDSTPEEFESHDLKREKIVKGNSKITVHIGPLKPGSYAYFGEFNQDTAKGTIVAK